MSQSPRPETNISDRERPSSLHSVEFEWRSPPSFERNSSTSELPKSGTAFTSTAGGLVQGSCIGSPEPFNHFSSLSSHHPGSSVPWAPWNVDVDWPSTTLALDAPSQTTKGGSAVESRLDTISVNAGSPSTGHSAQKTSTSPAPKGNEGVHCPICQQVFRRLPDLRRHVNGKHNRKQHFCPICSMSFARKDKCIEHVRRQHGSASYPEGQLDRQRHPRLEDAIKLPRVQKAPDMYLCTEYRCFKIFDSNAERVRHQLTHISKDERPFKCEECALPFLCPKDSERHANTHKDDNDETNPTIH